MPTTTDRGPIAKTEMVIRKPVDQVFNALIDPAITTQFWFTKSSGKLAPGKRVRWDWEMYGVGTNVDVKNVDTNKRILIEWDSYVGRAPVEWKFVERPAVRPGSRSSLASETEYRSERHPHYGRFLKLEPNRLVEITWVTGAAGTKGAETVVTVELQPQADGALLELTHAGFLDEPSLRQHEDAWHLVLAQLDERAAE